MCTPGVGAEYEINVPAYFALKLNSQKDVKDFSIRSNASEEFGNLDDVIINVTLENGEFLNFAFQLKHSEKDKNLTPAGFEIPRGDFSLEKYCKTFRKIPDDKRESYHYILYTSQNFDSKRKNEVKRYSMLDDDRCPGRLFFDTRLDTSSRYKFEVNDKSSQPASKNNKGGVEITKLEYQSFFSRFTLYTCQKKFRDIETLIFELLKEQRVVNSYLNLFRKWHQGLFTNKTIDRRTINTHLVDMYLSTSLITDSRLSDNENQKMYLFERATKEFDVTVIKECKENFITNLQQLGNLDNTQLKTTEISNFEEYKSRYRMDAQSTLTDCMFRLAKEYKFVEKTQKNLDEDTKNKLFSFCFQNSLIVDFEKCPPDALYKLMEVYQIKEDKIAFVLLGRDVDLSKLSAVRVFHDLDCLLKRNDQLYNEITTQCMLSFQGRRSITLKAFSESLEDVNSVVGTKEMIEMLTSGLSIGEGKIDLPKHYVPRSVSSTVFPLSTILSLSQDDDNIVIVSFNGLLEQIKGHIQNEEIDIVEIAEYIRNKKFSAKNSVILSLTKDPNFEKELETISTEKPKMFIHVFKMAAEDTFILTRSNFKSVCKHSKRATFSQDEIHSMFDGTLNLLVAEPGMGKSTFMKYLRNEFPRNYWTIYTDLKSHSDFFSQSHTTEKVLAHFMKHEPQEANFLKKLKEVFKQKKKIALFLDGLDELPRSCVENVLEAVDKLSQMGHHVWMSSRLNLEDQLSEKYKRFTLRLVELCEEEQKRYINGRLKSRYNEQEVAGFIDRIFEGIRVTNNKQFLGIPLQLYIITQIFLDEVKHKEDITETFFVLTKLYRYFFKGRYQHCFSKEKQETHSSFLPDAVEYLEQYEIAALETILDEEAFQKLQLDCRRTRRFLKKIESEKDVLGIITGVNNGKAIFEHQTYAEYFACQWFKDNQKRVELLKTELFSPNYEAVRVMLNMMLAENNPLHLSIIYKNEEQFFKHAEEVDSRDEAGRTALHIACSFNLNNRLDEVRQKWVRLYNHLPVEKSTCNNTMFETLFEKSNISKKDNLFGFDCLDYACASGNLYAIEIALRQQRIKFSAWKQVVYQNFDRENLIMQCVVFGYPNLFSEIIEESPGIVNRRIYSQSLFRRAMEAYCHSASNESSEKYAKIVQILIEKIDVNEVLNSYTGDRALAMTCRFGNLEMVKNLLDKGATETDYYKNTPLHAACECKHPNENIINFLISKGFDINAKNKFGTTPFHLACTKGHLDIINKMLHQQESSVSATLKITDKEGNNALHYAARSEEDNRDIISLLINKGIDVNSQNSVGRTPLYSATFCYNTVQLLEMGADVNIVDSGRDTALAQALRSSGNRNEKLRVIDQFMKYNYDMNSEHATRALNHSCRNGDLKIVKALIDKGAKADHETLHDASESWKDNTEVINFLLKVQHLNVSATNSTGKTPLHLACRYGTFENIKILLESGANPKSLDRKNLTPFDYLLKRSPRKPEMRNLSSDNISTIGYRYGRSRKRILELATHKSNLKTVENLIEIGLNENISDESGNNALHYASQACGQTGAIVSKLAEAGFGVNVPNKDGTSALQLACQSGNLEIVLILLHNGADVNHLDKKGNNALHYASMTVQKNNEIIDFLISRGVNLDAVNGNGTTALHLACEHGSLHNLMKLLQNGATLYKLDKNQENALWYAVSSEKHDGEEIVSFLISKGLDSNSSTKDGTPILQLACQFEKFQLALWLSRNGANLTKLDTNGNTVLHHASKSQTLPEVSDFIDSLIVQGIDVNARNNFGQTALHLACESARRESVETLLNHGADVNVLDNQQKNALDYVKDSIGIRELLISRGLKIRTDQGGNKQFSRGRFSFTKNFCSPS